jgi:hypothetical protein
MYACMCTRPRGEQVCQAHVYILDSVTSTPDKRKTEHPTKPSWVTHQRQLIHSGQSSTGLQHSTWVQLLAQSTLTEPTRVTMTNSQTTGRAFKTPVSSSWHAPTWCCHRQPVIPHPTGRDSFHLPQWGDTQNRNWKISGEDSWMLSNGWLQVLNNPETD